MPGRCLGRPMCGNLLCATGARKILAGRAARWPARARARRLPCRSRDACPKGARVGRLQIQAGRRRTQRMHHIRARHGTPPPSPGGQDTVPAQKRWPRGSAMRAHRARQGRGRTTRGRCCHPCDQAPNARPRTPSLPQKSPAICVAIDFAPHGNSCRSWIALPRSLLTVHQRGFLLPARRVPGHRARQGRGRTGHTRSGKQSHGFTNNTTGRGPNCHAGCVLKRAGAAVTLATKRQTPARALRCLKKARPSVAIGGRAPGHPTPSMRAPPRAAN
jgi:hypothetical protein